MNPRTDATLQELRSADWFSAVGTPADDVVVVTSWSAAVAMSTAAEWEGVQLEMGNRLSTGVHKASPKRFALWNQSVEEIKGITAPLVRERVAPFVRESRLPQGFIDVVQWDILHVGLEAEYSDVVPPAFFAGLAYWYVQGRFPCGWRSRPEPGRLVIY